MPHDCPCLPCRSLVCQLRGATRLPYRAALVCPRLSPSASLPCCTCMSAPVPVGFPTVLHLYVRAYPRRLPYRAAPVCPRLSPSASLPCCTCMSAPVAVTSSQWLAGGTRYFTFRGARRHNEGRRPEGSGGPVHELPLCQHHRHRRPCMTRRPNGLAPLTPGRTHSTPY